MSIKKQIRLGGAILAGTFLLQAGVSTFMERRLVGAGDDERLMAEVMHNHMQADMVHDALRGTVYRAIHAVNKGDAGERDAAIGEIADYGEEMRKAVDANRKLPLPADIHQGLETVAGGLTSYTAAADQIATALTHDPAAAEALLPAFETAFHTLEASQDAVAKKIEARQHDVDDSAEWTGQASLVLMLLLAALFGGLLVLAIRRLTSAIVTPIDSLATRLEAMTHGNFDVAIEAPQGDDEVAAIQSAARAFREAGLARRAAETEQAEVVAALAHGLEALAKGDLTSRIESTFPASYEGLRSTFNATVAQLADVLQRVSAAAEQVASGSAEIRSASDDLARRNEQQAASVEETSAAMGEVTHGVRQTADSAVTVQQAISNAHHEACEGGKVVTRATAAMAAIEHSSQEISQIINVIDGIAFQTNLLALNAGVEAARAGDAGRGFAVVANEVRALAQRSADAAKDIKALITTSTEQVGAGVALVGETGRLLEHIVAGIGDITTRVADIATSAQSQAVTLQQVNTVVSEMDRVTQQNAAMVEQSTAASRSLAQESTRLGELVTQFRLPGSSQRSATPRPAHPVRYAA